MPKLTTDVQNAVTATSGDGTDLTKLAGDLDASVSTLRADGAKSGDKKVTNTFNGVADAFATMSSSAKAGQTPDVNSLLDKLQQVAQQNGTAGC